MATKNRRDVGTTPSANEDAPPPKPKPARFFRAVVVTALATMAPAAGCYDSTSGDDVAGDADARDAADASDAADHIDAVVPYGAPEYGAPDYGVP
jgi:hypothetical protein